MISWKSNPIEITNKCLAARDPAQPGLCAFSANPISVLQGGATTLSWYCPLPNTTYTIEKQTATDGPWSAVQSGSIPSSRAGTRSQNPLLNTTYRLTCGGAGTTPGVGTANVTVNQPNLSLTATPNEIPVGGSTKLTWNTQNVTPGFNRLSLVGGGLLSSLDSSVIGLTVKPLTLPATYTLTGRTPASVAGTAPAPSVTVTVFENGKGPKITTFYGDPDSVRKGNSTKLYWTGTNLPASCSLSSNPTIAGLPSSVSSTATGNSTGVSTGAIQQKTEFKLTCGTTGNATAIVTIIPVFQEI